MSSKSWIIPLLLFPLLLNSGCGGPADGAVPVYEVKRGDFYSTITVTGELEAVRSQIISAPRLDWSMGLPKVARLVEDGKKVEQGELLVEFDPSEVEKTIVDARNELDIAKAELSKALVNHQTEIEDLESNLEIAKIDLQIARLKLEQSTFDAEIKRKEIELQVENSQIQAEQAASEIENKKKVQHEERSKLELKVNQAQSKLDEAQRTLESLTINAPTPGIAILRDNWSTGEKVAVNDQVYPGWPMIGLPDLNLLRADADVNEIDISRVAVGQKVNVKLDAYPDTSFTGAVKEIATLATNKNRGSSSVKVFETMIYIDGQDERLLPGMTVSCEIMVDEVPDTIYIPLEALFFRDGERVVFVKKGRGFDERRIKIGSESENFAVVIEGVEEGDEVALIDPFASDEEQADSTAGKEPKE